MQTLTIPLPDETAAQIDRLPDNERRAFLEKMQNFAAASLSGADEESEEENFPPLPPLLSESLTDALRAGFADADAGRVTSGEAFFAEMRRHAAANK